MRSSCARSYSATPAPPTTATSTILESLFHPDAVDRRRPRQPDAGRVARRDARAAHVPDEHARARRPAHRPRRRQTLDTYAVVYQLGDRGRGQADLTLGIRYLDDVVQHDGRWVIRHRVASTLWMR